MRRRLLAASLASVLLTGLRGIGSDFRWFLVYTWDGNGVPVVLYDGPKNIKIARAVSRAALNGFVQFDTTYEERRSGIASFCSLVAGIAATAGDASPG